MTMPGFGDLVEPHYSRITSEHIYVMMMMIFCVMVVIMMMMKRKNACAQ
jgi:hypothetical protein